MKQRQKEDNGPENRRTNAHPSLPIIAFVSEIDGKNYVCYTGIKKKDAFDQTKINFENISTAVKR